VSIELAVALSAIATKAIVANLIQGAPMTRDGWADVAGQVVETVINTAAHQESGFQGLGQKIDKVSQQIDEIPMREFDQHMAAGRRYLRDLPAAWRTDQDRRDLIHDARAEFVRAVAIAELGNDLRRQALAEVAIAGSWLWVPSINDVRNAAGQARQLLERDVLFGAYPVHDTAWSVGDYTDVLRLCKAYGERSAYAVLPALSSPGARLTVSAALDHWVECADMWVHVARDQQPESATPPPAAVAKRVTPPFPGYIGIGRTARQTGQPRITPGFSAAPVQRDPPVILKVTVENKRAAPVMVSFSQSAARIKFGTVRRSLSSSSLRTASSSPRSALSTLEPAWSSLASGERTTRRVNVPSVASPGTGVGLAPYRPGIQPRQFALRDPGILQFLYPAQL
jgi:hypothetical protein